MEFYITKTIRYNHRVFLLAVSAYRKDNRIKLLITIHNGVNTVIISENEKIKKLLPNNTNKFQVKKITKRFSTYRYIYLLLLQKYNSTLCERKIWDFLIKKMVITYSNDLIPLKTINIHNNQSLYRYKDLVLKKNLDNL